MGRPPLITMLAVGLPLLPMLVWPFAAHWRYPDLLPADWTLRGLRYLLDFDSRVPLAAGNSLLLGLLVAVTSVLIAVPAGMALGDRRFNGRARALVLLALLMPVLVPPLASALGVHTTFITLGLADTRLGVYLVHLIPAVPYASLIMAAVFANRDGESEAAARSLGAGPRRTFAYVTLPEVLPGVAVAAFLAFLISWGQYLLSLLIGGGLIVTLPMLLFSAASGGDPVITAAVGLLFAAPVLLVLPLALRAMRRGETEPALPGRLPS